jgi:hypothetical protein
MQLITGNVHIQRARGGRKRCQKATQARHMLSAHPSRFPRGKKPFQPLMAKPYYHVRVV